MSDIGNGLIVVILISAIFSFIIFITKKMETDYSKIAKEREILQKQKRCQHGVVGAYSDINKCEICSKNAIASREERNAVFMKSIKTKSFFQNIDPRNFETICAELYKKMGYEVELTKYVADNGVDAYLRKDGCLGILQAKRFKGFVGEPILRDAYGAMHAANATFVVIITTGKVSWPAKKWASGKPIRIIQLKELVELIESHHLDDDVILEILTTSKNNISCCPIISCNGILVKRKGKFGVFWGCSNYPACSYTNNIKRK